MANTIEVDKTYKHKGASYGERVVITGHFGYCFEGHIEDHPKEKLIYDIDGKCLANSLYSTKNSDLSWYDIVFEPVKTYRFKLFFDDGSSCDDWEESSYLKAYNENDENVIVVVKESIHGKFNRFFTTTLIAAKNLK